MSSQALNVIAALASAVAAVSALIIAYMSLVEARRSAHLSRRNAAMELEAHLQSRLDPMYPGLRRVLGTVDDGIPVAVREVLVPFFVLYADAYAAYRDALITEDDWEGLGTQMANWAQRPNARRAWERLKKQEWTRGFSKHMEAVMSGPPAYQRMADIPLLPPTVEWPLNDASDTP